MGQSVHTFVVQIVIVKVFIKVLKSHKAEPDPRSSSPGAPGDVLIIKIEVDRRPLHHISERRSVVQRAPSKQIHFTLLRN